MRLWSTVLLIMTVCECIAIPANPMPCRMKQPDGSFVTLRMQGDEYLNFVTTTDGFTVVRDKRGFWVYASKQADGALAATGMVAHDADDRKADERAFLDSTPKWLAPKMSDNMAQSRQRERARRAKTLEQRRAPSNDYYSKFRGLVILVEYKDRPFMYGDETNEIMNDIFNKENYTGDSRTNFVDESQDMDVRFVGSVHDYYRDNSNGLFQPKFDIVGPVKVNLSQYDAKKTQNSQLLAQTAVDAADPLVDFSKYDVDGNGEVDFVYLVFSGFTSSIIGNDERLLWPHESSLDYRKDGVTVGKFACSTEMGVTEQLPMLDGIGTICHEMGHVLGLPDFYNTDNDGSGGTAPDPGGWSVMASGVDHMYKHIPCNFTLYERYLLGFCQMPAVLNEVGTYSLREVTTNEGFRIDSPNNNEFFIIENRQQTGWDVELPGHGMLVFRVENNPLIWKANKVNDNPKHMYYELFLPKDTRAARRPTTRSLEREISPCSRPTRRQPTCEHGRGRIANMG
jgi:M6 family metalloprotease-like protein